MSNRALSNSIKVLPIVLSVILAQGAVCRAAAPQPAQASGPVDIQANEQEFAGDKIIAKGNVRVTYKDSVITAPTATLQRDAGGNPQSAVFTGHPHLVQGKSVINADVLQFDIINSRVIADGNSHSEVEQTEDTPDKKAADGDKTADGADGSTDQAPKRKSLIAVNSAAKSGEKGSAPEKIITDADHQEYARDQDKFEAIGHVKVIHGDITVHAQKLQMVYGSDKKPETAIFNGTVEALQGQNNTLADSITYSLVTKRLQATGHVRSKVVQPKKEDKKADASQPGSNNQQAALPVDGGAAYAATTSSVKAGPQNSGNEDPIIIISNNQENSEETGRLSADGNVKVYYQDMCGIGPKAILVRNAEGKAEKVYFVGRSQMSQTGRRWIADHITMVIADKKVLAEGNTKAFIIQEKPKKNNDFPYPVDSKLAGKPTASPNSISSTKVERPQ